MADITKKPAEEKGAIPGNSRSKLSAGIGLTMGALLIGLGFTLRGQVEYAVGTVFVLLGAVLMVLSIVVLYRRRERKFSDDEAINAEEAAFLARIKAAGDRREAALRAAEAEELTTSVAASVVLSVEPSIRDLAYAYPQNLTSLRLDAALRKRTFAALSVKNTGTENAKEIVAECRVVSSSAVVPCHWSKESDGKFSLGGRHAEGVNVCQERVLLIAQAFGDNAHVFGEKRFWAPLPEDQEILFHEMGFSAVPLDQRMTSVPGEPVTIDRSKAELIVTLRAKGINHTERILLSFDSEVPTISLS
jgi:hypothetical protein